MNVLQVLGDTGARFIPRVVYLSGAWKAGLRHYILRLIQLVKVHLLPHTSCCIRLELLNCPETLISVCAFSVALSVLFHYSLSFILYNICAFL